MTELVAPVEATPVSQAIPGTPPAAATPPINAVPLATPPAPAPEVLETPAEPVADTGFSYQQTGDPGLDIALEFIGKAGFGIDHPAVVEAIDGKFDKLEAHLAALGDKATGYERMLQLAKGAYERNSAETATKQTAITSAVHEVAGGAEQWSAIKTWAVANADPGEKAEINAMLSAGPMQARAAALLLSNLHRNAGGTTVNPANPVNLNAAPAPTGNGALSKADYPEAVRELRSRLGSGMDSSPEYAALQARRSAWRG